MRYTRFRVPRTFPKRKLSARSRARKKARETERAAIFLFCIKMQFEIVESAANVRLRFARKKCICVSDDLFNLISRERALSCSLSFSWVERAFIDRFWHIRRTEDAKPASSFKIYTQFREIFAIGNRPTFNQSVEFLFLRLTHEVQIHDDG